MAQFTQNGVIYEELPDGNVRVVGYADQQPQGMQIKPADPTRQYQGPQAQARWRQAQRAARHDGPARLEGQLQIGQRIGADRDERW